MEQHQRMPFMSVRLHDGWPHGWAVGAFEGCRLYIDESVISLS